MSTTEGLQVPEIPFVEEAGNVGTIPPAQIVELVPKLNVGVVRCITLMVTEMGKPH